MFKGVNVFIQSVTLTLQGRTKVMLQHHILKYQELSNNSLMLRVEQTVTLQDLLGNRTRSW